jgi:Tfp pilus assembly protein PilF
MADFDENDHYQEALLAIQQGLISKAETILQKVLTINPNMYNARESLIKLHIEQGKYNEAQHILDDGLAQNLQYIPFIQLKARLLVQNNQSIKALELLKNYSPVIEEYPDYYAMMAALYQQENSFKKAADIYSKLLTLYPEQAIWWLGFGISLENLGSKNEAIMAYKKASNFSDLNVELKSYIEDRMSFLS